MWADNGDVHGVRADQFPSDIRIVYQISKLQ